MLHNITQSDAAQAQPIPTIHVSLFDSVKSTTPKSAFGPWPNVAQGFTKRKILARKSDAPLISFARFNGPRSNANVECVTAVALDFDDGITPEQVSRLAGELEYLLHSTFSHTPEHPKFRVYLPLSRSVTSDEFRRIFPIIDARLGGKADKACRDPARMMYVPSCPPERATDALFEWHRGAILDPDELLAAPPPVNAMSPPNGWLSSLPWPPPPHIAAMNLPFLDFGVMPESEPAYAARAAQRCGFLSKVAEARGDVTEPIWYAALGVAAHCDDGEEVAHPWSDGHPGYSPEATMRKLAHARNAAGPTTCARFRELCSQWCEGCPHTVKSPIQLGREVTSALPPATMLMENSPFDIVRRGDISAWVGTTPEPVEFVIADFVERGAIALLAGEGGAGKSYTALNAGMAVAADIPFYGKKALPGRVVCLFAEDSSPAIHARLARLCEALEVPMGDLVGRLYPVSLVDDPIEDRTLWENGRPTNRMRALEDELATMGDIKLLVIDNVTQVFNDDEISRGTVGRFLGALTGLARRLNLGIILIHHTSKSSDGSTLRMASGSTAWIAQCRAAAELRKATKDEGPRFSVRKINNGIEWEVELCWADGVLMPAAEVSETVAEVNRRRNDQAFLDCLAAVARQGRTVGDAKQGRRYAPRNFVGMTEAQRANVRDLESAMGRLFASGRIRIATGKDSSRKDQAEIVAVPSGEC